MLLIVLHALLDIGDESLGRERSAGFGINIHRSDFVDALALKLREDFLGDSEKLRPVRVDMTEF
jgi:hypothetical protein